MIITFLGTGTSQGVPVIGCECDVCRSLDFRDKRLRTSVHIQSENTSVVIDTGPDFRQQMLRERIKKVDAVVYTHEHKDHTAGLDDIRSFNFLQKTDIPIYGRKSVLNQIKNEFSYAFSEKKYPGTPEITTVEINEDRFDINGLEFIPIEVMHYKLPVLGFRIGDFTYVTDANSIPPDQIEKIKGSKILVLNALRIEPHISHFSLEEAIDMATKIGAETTYFTHMSHLMGRHSEVSEKLPEGIMLAWDGLKLEV